VSFKSTFRRPPSPLKIKGTENNNTKTFKSHSSIMSSKADVNIDKVESRSNKFDLAKNNYNHSSKVIDIIPINSDNNIPLLDATCIIPPGTSTNHI
jgi:hypothetical protein